MNIVEIIFLYLGRWIAEWISMLLEKLPSHDFLEFKIWDNVTPPLLFIVAFFGLLTWLIQRITRNLLFRRICYVEEKKFAHWSDALLKALIQPLNAFIWVTGIYAALAPLLSAWNENLLSHGANILKYAFFILFYWFLFRAIGDFGAWLKQKVTRTANALDDALAPLLPKILYWALAIVILITGSRYFNFSEELRGGLHKFIGIVIIIAVASSLIQLVRVLDKIILAHYQIDTSDNLAARKIYTQTHVLQKIAYVIIGVVSVSCILMLFDNVRQLGMSILTSAGVAGIIVGFAAQRAIANLFAGIQIAFTQPIRIDDVVVVENEWGRIEEITLTYVVVKIWDLRRLVIPLSYFIEKPFQNWTRSSADILGTIFLYMDYTVPVNAIRKELQRIVDKNPLWDGKVCGVQVTDSKENVVEVRALVSAEDSGKAWDLRCEVREKLISFLQQNYPQSLPRLRAELGK